MWEIFSALYFVGGMIGAGFAFDQSVATRSIRKILLFVLVGFGLSWVSVGVMCGWIVGEAFESRKMMGEFVDALDEFCLTIAKPKRRKYGK